MIPRTLLGVGSASVLCVFLCASGTTTPAAPVAKTQSYLVLGASVGDQTCMWSYAVCDPSPCVPSVTFCGASGPTAPAGPMEWAIEIADEITNNLTPPLDEYTANAIAEGLGWKVQITGPEPFVFFVGPCTGCVAPVPGAMTAVFGTPISLGGGGGGGATIQQLPGGGGGPALPLAGIVALFGVLGFAGMRMLRASRPE